MTMPKTILITGASSGLGAALARYYAQSGVILHLSGKDEVRLKEVAQRCSDLGADVAVRVVDVTDMGAMRDWIEEVDERTPLDLVIANAGISAGTGGVLHGEPPEQVHKVFDVNLKGVLNTIEPIIPRMVARGRGQIAIMSSLASFRAFPGAPAYGASKAAVRVYGEALRGSLYGTGVRINVICPGFIKTPMTKVNPFPMPFLMSPERAAKHIVRSLARDKSRIAFPWPVAWVVWLLMVLPDCLSQKILCAAPTKPQENL